MMKTRSAPWLTALSLTLLAGCGGDATSDTSGGGGTTATTTAAGGGGAGGASTSGGGGTGGATATGGSGGTSATTTTSTATGCGECEWECCGAQCVNKDNDVKNCGDCGVQCPGPDPYCDHGVCGKPPCDTATCEGGELCCGTMCCAAGQLCCTVPGPIGEMTSCLPPDTNGTCPVGCNQCKCNSPDTPIATPDGERRIADLQVGDLVYSVHEGAIVAVPLRAVTRVPAPSHVVQRITLEGGRTLEISAAHPTADGRRFSDLRAGGELSGIPILEARTVPFEHDATHDILPASSTGTYFAAGAQIGSTLAAGESL